MTVQAVTDHPLRAACIHGRYEKHAADIAPAEPCSGGRDIPNDATFTSKYNPDTNSYGHPMEMGDWFWEQGKGVGDVVFVVAAIGDTDEPR